MVNTYRSILVEHLTPVLSAKAKEIISLTIYKSIEIVLSESRFNLILAMI